MREQFRKFAAGLIVGLGFLMGGKAVAVDVCQDANIWGQFIIDGICWSCVFPIKAMNGTMGDEDQAPAGAHDGFFCMCEDRWGVPEFGVAAGMWHATKIVELTNVPYCSPALGGLRINDSWKLLGGPNVQHDANEGQGKAYYNYHLFAYPIFEIIEIFVMPQCSVGGYVDFDLLMMSEIDPTWNDPELTLFAVPEAVIFTSLPAQMAAFADCPASSFGRPIDDIYWFAGCWGSMYPFSGHILDGYHPVRNTSLAATRAIAQQHRRGFATRTVGEDVMCEPEFFPHIKKSQYKMSMMYPTPESEGPDVPQFEVGGEGTDGGQDTADGTDDSDTNYRTLNDEQRSQIGQPGDWPIQEECCHSIGENTFTWGEHRAEPGKPQHLYLLWQWVDCCVRTAGQAQ